jgi:hypothetical protein
MNNFNNNGFTTIKAKEPPRLRKGLFGGKQIQTQAEVTQNVNVSGSLPKYRQNSVRNNTSDERLGELLSNEFLDIMPGELVFMEKANYKGTNRYTATYGAGFTSFNAIQTGEPQRRFEDRFKAIGFAKIEVSPSKVDRVNNGVSVIVAGSLSIRNNGNDTFNPGDLITYKLPNVDKIIREKESNVLPKVEGIPKGKHVAIMKKLDHHDLTDIIFDAYDSVFHEFDINEMDLFKKGNNRYFSDDKELGILLRTVDLTKGMGLLVTLYQKGLIDINAPENPLTPGGYNSYDNQLSQPLSKFDNQRYSFRESKMEDTDDEAIKYLAYKLGLLKADAYQKHLTPNKNMILDLTVRMNAGLLDDDIYRKYYSIRKAFSEKESGKKLRNNNLTEIGKLERLQFNSSTMLHQAYKSAVDRVDSKIIGIATNNSIPGTILDLYR